MPREVAKNFGYSTGYSPQSQASDSRGKDAGRVCITKHGKQIAGDLAIFAIFASKKRRCYGLETKPKFLFKRYFAFSAPWTPETRDVREEIASGKYHI